VHRGVPARHHVETVFNAELVASGPATMISAQKRACFLYTVCCAEIIAVPLLFDTLLGIYALPLFVCTVHASEPQRLRQQSCCHRLHLLMFTVD
jgi:hypothetical protein